MRSTWTDSRLDVLNGRVEKIAEEMCEVRSDLREIRGEIGALQRTIIQVGGGLCGVLVIGILSLLGTQM